MTNLLTPALTALVAVLPALLAAWWGRRLARLADDPALPERLLAMRTRNGIAIGIAVGLLYSLGTSRTWWSIPLLVVARLVAGYRVRKHLYQETWGLFGYCSFYVRLVAAVFGFWILLSVTPAIASMAGSYALVAGAALAVVLIVGNEMYASVFSAVMRATAVADDAIRSRFAAMVSASGLPDVTLRQVHMRGGQFVNAVALPSLRTPTVVVTSTLLERLDADETAAILAHELAHLEHYNRRRLHQLNVLTYTLIATAVLLVPGARMAGGESLGALMWLWQIVLVVAMFQRARDRQKHETASDLRAVALCGNADALARALVKIHAAARLPRRWEADWERHASHPSLARRIQSLHEAAGTAPLSLRDAVTFNTADGLTRFTFHEDRFAWTEQNMSTHAVPYPQLTTLRVDARGMRGARLVAVDASHRRWQFPIPTADVPRVQATLDIVDARLAAAAPPPAVPLMLPRVLALMAVIACLSLDQPAAAVIAAAVGMMPTLPTIGAAGGATVGVAAILFRDSTLMAGDWRPWYALALLVCGAALIVVNVMNRRERTPVMAARGVWALAAAAVVALAGVALSSSSVMELYRGARDWPSAVVCSLALAGALAFMRARPVRYASALVLTAGMATVVAGSDGFRDQFVKDPFLATAPMLNVKAISRLSQADFEVPQDVETLWVSPRGTHVAFRTDDDDEMKVYAGTAGGALTTFNADAAWFVDESRLLVLERDDPGSLLRLVDLDQDASTIESWRLPLYYGRLSFDRARNVWHVGGWNEDEIVSVSGRPGSAQVVERRWAYNEDEGASAYAVAVSGGTLLALERRYPASVSGDGLDAAVKRFMLPRRRTGFRLVRVTENGTQTGRRSALDLTCASIADEGTPTSCAAFDGTATRLFAVDPAYGRPTVAGYIPGELNVYNHAGDGWVMGLWRREAVLVRVATHEILRVAAPAGDEAYEITMAEKVVATATSSRGGTTIHIYPR